MRSGLASRVSCRICGLVACVAVAFAVVPLRTRAEGIDCTKARKMDRLGDHPLSLGQALLRQICAKNGPGLLSACFRAGRGPSYSPAGSQTLAQTWDDMLPVSSSVMMTRRAATCTLSYQTSDAPVALGFFCTPY